MSAINHYKNIEFQLYGLLIQLRDLFKANSLSEQEAAHISGIIELIQTKKFNVAVMGEFKRGKSSLINAMLGVKILPSDITPATATINRITYGTEPSLTIYYHNGTTEKANLDNLSDYVTMLTEEGTKRAAQIKEAVIQYPTVICQNHVDIIDTPGLSDREEMTSVSMKMLGVIDAAIVVISALSPFSEKEMEFVCELIQSEGVESIVFVVTYIDQIDEDEQEEFITYIRNRIFNNVINEIEKEHYTEAARTKAKRMINDSPVFGVSSLLALKSFVTGDRKLLRQSKFEAFKTELYELLTAQQGENIVRKALNCIYKTSSIFDALCCEKIVKLEQNIQLAHASVNRIKTYSIQSRHEYLQIFKKRENQFAEALRSIFELKNTFLGNFRVVLNGAGARGPEELVKVLSAEAAGCWTVVMEELGPKIKDTVVALFEAIIDDYCTLRERQLIQPIEGLNQLFGIEWKSLECFTDRKKGMMMSSGFPVFRWYVSPVPNIQFLHQYNLMENIKYAVDVSMQRYYDHWNSYLDSLKGWWLQQIEIEAGELNRNIFIRVEKAKAKLADELSYFKNNYGQQKVIVQEINAKAEEIEASINRRGGQNEYE